MSANLPSAAASLLEAIRTRRTVPFTAVSSEPIQEAHLLALLEAANWAPSHGHTEPWRFAVFRGEGRRRLAELLAATYKAAHAHDFKEKKYQKQQERPLAVGAVLAILMHPGEQPVMPEYEELLAMGGAVQNLHLVAHSLGIGASWSTPDYLEHPNIRAFFGLGERDRCLGFHYLGYRVEEPPRGKRGELAEKITYIES